MGARSESVRDFPTARERWSRAFAQSFHSTQLTAGVLASAAMSHIFPSEDWAAAYKKAINDNPKYKEAGKDWTHGAVAMVVKADPALGIAEDTALWLDIDRGVCKDCKLMPASDAQAAPFVIVADYARWKTVIKKESTPSRA